MSRQKCYLMCLWYIFAMSRPEFLRILLNWDNKTGVDTALRQINKSLIDVFLLVRFSRPVLTMYIILLRKLHTGVYCNMRLSRLVMTVHIAKWNSHQCFDNYVLCDFGQIFKTCVLCHFGQNVKTCVLCHFGQNVKTCLVCNFGHNGSWVDLCAFLLLKEWQDQ